MNTISRENKTNAVFGRTLSGTREDEDHPLLAAMNIKREIITKYCPISKMRFPINHFYPITGSVEEVRRVCRMAWDCVVIDPETGESVAANGTKKYDHLVRKELESRGDI